VIAPLFQIPVNRIDGRLTTLAEYQGSLLLIVNVASACGLSPQYAALESVYEKFHTRGFVVLGFPGNDFGGQEPGSNEEIQRSCERSTRCSSRFSRRLHSSRKAATDYTAI
jgi:glutathione peroxidase